MSTIRLTPTLLGAAMALSLALPLSAAFADGARNVNRPAAARPHAGQVHRRLHERRPQRSGTVDSSRTITRPDGKTATRETTGTYDAEAGTWERHTTSTGFNGKTRSVDVDVTRTEDGLQRNRTVTLPDGRTATGSTTLERTEDGFTRDSSMTNPNGKTVTQHVEGSYDADTNTATRIKSTTGPNGQTRTTTTTRTVTPAEPAQPSN